jgi:hypothetical protein
MELSAPYVLQILRVSSPEVKGSIHTITFLPITCQIFLTTFEQECHTFNVMAVVDIPIIPIQRK